MTWRLYLKFLRPLRSLAVVAIYSLTAWAMGEKWWRASSGEAVLPTLVVALPLICGLFIAGGTHEPLHQQLAAVLPRLRRSMRMKAVLTLLIMTVAVTLMTYRLRPEIPILASFGLIGAAMAAPCVGQHRHPGNKLELLLLLLVWFLTVALGGTQLSAGMNAAPLLWLLGGMGAAGLFVMLGFSREVCRMRATTRFLAPQSMLFNLSVVRGMLLDRQKASQQKTSRRDEASRLAQARRQRISTADWVAAMRLGQAGSARQMPIWKGALLVSVGYIVALLVVPGMKERNINPEVLFIVLLFNGFAVMQQAQPVVRFPVSRRKMAALVFRRQFEIMALVLCLPVVVITIAAWAVYWISGLEKLPVSPQSIMVAGMLAAPVFPLLGTCGAVLRKKLRIASVIIVSLVMVMLIASHSFLQFWVLSLPGILTLGLLAGLGLVLLRWRLDIWYARVDLSKAALFLNAIGPSYGGPGGWWRKGQH